MTDGAAPVPTADPVAPAAGLAPVVVETAAPVAAPAVAESAPAVVVETPAVVEAPAAETPVAEPAAPVVDEPEAKPAEEPKAPERPKTLLEKADEAAKEAADKAKKPGEESAKLDEAAKPPEGDVPPLEFEVPANLKVVPEQLAEFTDLLRSTKSGDLKESGQKLLDMHAKAIETFAKNYVQQTSDNQWKVWNELIATKDKEVLADPVIGGAGHDTAMAAIVRMRDLGVPETDRAAFTEMLNVTGVGSWPPFLRMLHRFAEIFDEPPMPAPGGKPPKDAHIQQPRGQFALLHDHPSSQMKKD